MIHPGNKKPEPREGFGPQPEWWNWQTQRNRTPPAPTVTTVCREGSKPSSGTNPCGWQASSSRP